MERYTNRSFDESRESLAVSLNQLDIWSLAMMRWHVNPS